MINSKVTRRPRRGQARSHSLCKKSNGAKKGLNERGNLERDALEMFTEIFGVAREAFEVACGLIARRENRVLVFVELPDGKFVARAPHGTHAASWLAEREPGFAAFDHVLSKPPAGGIWLVYIDRHARGVIASTIDLPIFCDGCTAPGGAA